MPEIEWINSEEVGCVKCEKLERGVDVFKIDGARAIYTRIYPSCKPWCILALDLHSFHTTNLDKNKKVEVVGLLKKVCISSIEP